MQSASCMRPHFGVIAHYEASLDYSIFAANPFAL